MARPTDWIILDLDRDPTPGDPQRVKAIAGWMRDIGDEAERASRDVRGLAGDDAVMGWIGASGDAFRSHIGKFPGQLDKVATSHHLCADALHEYSTSLDTCQSQADRALVQARPVYDQVQRLQAQLASAHTGLASAGRGVTAAQAAATVDPTSFQNAIRNQSTAQSAIDSLNSQLSGPTAQLEVLKKLALSAESLRNTAEDTAKTKIHTAADAGIPPDSMWHKLGHLAGELWHGLVIVAEVVSCIGGLILLVVGGPVWLIVAVVAAGLIIFTDTVNKYAHGQASLWQVGLSFLACIPITKSLTSMSALGEAFRTGGVLGAGTHLAGAFGGAAKDLLGGMSTLLKGGSGKLAGILSDGSRAPIRAFADGRPGFKLFHPAEVNFTAADQIPAEPGFFDVSIHGSPNNVAYQFQGPLESAGTVNWQVLSHDDLANMIKSGGWDGKSPIRLLACSTGKLPDGMAQKLADTLGVAVKAPNDILWLLPDGPFVAAPNPVNPAFPDLNNPGSFTTFFPTTRKVATWAQ